MPQRPRSMITRSATARSTTDTTDQQPDTSNNAEKTTTRTDKSRRTRTERPQSVDAAQPSADKTTEPTQTTETTKIQRHDAKMLAAASALLAALPPQPGCQILKNTKCTIDKLINHLKGPHQAQQHSCTEEITVLEQLERLETTYLKPLLSKAPIHADTTPKTWAQVANTTTTPHRGEEQARALAAKADREIRVRTRGDDRITVQNTPADNILKTVHNNGASNILAARKLPNGGILFSASSDTTKAALLKDTKWLAAVAKTASIVHPTYTVIAHNVPLNLVNSAAIENTIKNFIYNNRGIHPDLKIEKLQWLRRKLPQNKLRSSLVFHLPSPSLANKLIDEGIIAGEQLCEVEYFSWEFMPPQCFKCQKFYHTSTHCTASVTCGHCSKAHTTESCPTKTTLSCANCGGPHPAWSTDCRTLQHVRGKAKLLQQNRPYKYMVRKSVLPAANYEWSTASPDCGRRAASVDTLVEETTDRRERSLPIYDPPLTNNLMKRTAATTNPNEQ